MGANRKRSTTVAGQQSKDSALERLFARLDEVVAEKKESPETQARTPENNRENSGGELVPQRHGGALKRGGNWGNRGGGSRTLGFKRRLFQFRDEERAIRYVQDCLYGCEGHRAALEARRYIDALEDKGASLGVEPADAEQELGHR